MGEGLAALLSPSTSLRVLAAALLSPWAMEADVFEEGLSAGLSCLIVISVALLRSAPRGGSGPARAGFLLLGRPARGAPPALVAPALLYELDERVLGGKLRPRTVVPSLRSGIVARTASTMLTIPASPPVAATAGADGSVSSSPSV